MENIAYEISLYRTLTILKSLKIEVQCRGLGMN